MLLENLLAGDLTSLAEPLPALLLDVFASAEKRRVNVRLCARFLHGAL
jgi:hypothetical protein